MKRGGRGERREEGGGRGERREERREERGYVVSSPMVQERRPKDER